MSLCRLPVRRSRGFTLIEVLVVMVIVGVALGGVSVSVEALRARDGERALQRLQHVLEAAAEHGLLRGQPLRFEPLADGYRFSRLDADGQWSLREVPAVFAERVFPESLRWQNPAQMAALVFGSRAPRFTLDLRLDGQPAQLAGSATGQVVRARAAVAAVAPAGG